LVPVLSHLTYYRPLVLRTRQKILVLSDFTISHISRKEEEEGASAARVPSSYFFI
jgi:hypothetical protein